jgi:hypothetical protein
MPLTVRRLSFVILERTARRNSEVESKAPRIRDSAIPLQGVLPGTHIPTCTPIATSATIWTQRFLAGILIILLRNGARSGYLSVFSKRVKRFAVSREKVGPPHTPVVTAYSSIRYENSSITGLVSTSLAIRSTSALAAVLSSAPSRLSSKNLPWRTASTPL